MDFPIFCTIITKKHILFSQKVHTKGQRINKNSILQKQNIILIVKKAKIKKN